jgi:hypothetical protein
MQMKVMNRSAGANASSDIVVESDNATELGNFINLGINSTGYAGSSVGGPGDGYLFMTSSVGELHIGNATVADTSNVRIFTNGPASDANTKIFVSASGQVGIGVSNPRSTLQVQGNISASAFTGSINAVTFTQTASGSVSRAGGQTVVLNLANHNFFVVTATGTGTLTWSVTNVALSGIVQSFMIELTNGGLVTNAWFTNTRWPGGVAPTLSTAGVDLLGFITDDAGANWRGSLVQRASS